MKDEQIPVTMWGPIPFLSKWEIRTYDYLFIVHVTFPSQLDPFKGFKIFYYCSEYMHNMYFTIATI